MGFLKTGENRSQDSTETTKLQKQHLAFLSKMAEKGYASLIGPFGVMVIFVVLPFIILPPKKKPIAWLD